MLPALPNLSALSTTALAVDDHSLVPTGEKAYVTAVLKAFRKSSNEAMALLRFLRVVMTIKKGEDARQRAERAYGDLQKDLPTLPSWAEVLQMLQERKKAGPTGMLIYLDDDLQHAVEIVGNEVHTHAKRGKNKGDPKKNSIKDKVLKVVLDALETIVFVCSRSDCL